jgi:hypothetical protein
MLLFYFLTCVQKIRSMFQIKVAKFLIRPEIGGSTLGTCHGSTSKLTFTLHDNGFFAVDMFENMECKLHNLRVIKRQQVC